MQGSKMKTCKDCKQEKELSHFPANGSSTRSRCRTCHNDYRKALKTARKQSDKEIRISNIKSVLNSTFEQKEIK